MTRRRPSNVAVAAALCVFAALLTLSGCELFAAMAKVADGGNKVAAKYRLDNVKTAVIFDDPQNLLNNPSLARQVAATAVHYLEFKKVLRTAEFVPPAAVSKLEQKLGDRWPTTPIDTLGRQLGAAQVVYARLEKVDALVAGNVYRPRAQVDVKVVSADDGRRLWPNAGAMPSAAAPMPGYTLTVEMDYQTSDGRNLGGNTPDALARQLADEIGVSLARLFHNWVEDDMGSKL